MKMQARPEGMVGLCIQAKETSPACVTFLVAIVIIAISPTSEGAPHPSSEMTPGPWVESVLFFVPSSFEVLGMSIARPVPCDPFLVCLAKWPL